MTIRAAISDLSTLLGDRLSIGKSDLDLHGRSETHFALTPPDAVAYPTTTGDVQAIVRICANHRCPVIAWGTGTSLEGGGLAVRGGICVDFTRMDSILDINAADLDVRVQPGLTRSALNHGLRATGLMFPVDPGADASLGGMAATRASGTSTVRYGTMKQNVLALEAVLADGRVIRTGRRARKSSAGYDLTSLLVGSEGTLGLITELTLKLHGIPEATSAALCSFPTIAAAVDAVIATIQTGIPMARIEFVDIDTVTAFNTINKAAMPVLPHLMVEFHGSTAAVAEDAARFGDIAADFGADDFRWATRDEDRNRLWQMRHDAYRSILLMRPGARAVVTDLCVPISRLAKAVEETRADIAATGLPGPILGHVGDGNLHAILLISSPEDRAVAMQLSARMADRALRLGGTITGEHGVGMGKLGHMAAEHAAAWDVMGDIKRALDPLGIMNPGKVVRQD